MTPRAVNPTLTAMGGLLARTPDGWRWRDGAPEPRVRDLTEAEAFQFPRVTAAHPDDPTRRAVFVSVPVRALDDEPDLVEMLDAVGAAARNSEDDAGRVEVLETAWDAWARGRVIGVLWEAEDEAALFETAEAKRAALRRA